MRLFDKIRKLGEADRAATENSRALLEDLERTESHVQAQHEVALNQKKRAEKQAIQLKAADRRNHYSESLTYAYRGRPSS